ncbi:hypothetical protein F4859DRAFT_175224 [Xylaria cf. heliscus]|nr:hypothetical protein F4859DRAFT_175224 [Xylaria cf. heliscus]
MGGAQLQNPSSSALDALHDRQNGLRRARPPDIELIPNENRVPLRVDRTMKRESKIGLRGIFTRNKAGKLDKDIEEPSSRSGLRPASIRASLADFGNWPYRLHSSRSEASLISTASVDSRLIASDISSPYRPSHGSPLADKRQSVEPSNGGVVSKTWNPPPLFQVYPQAVKHATLPTCNISVETLTRNSEPRGSKLIQAARIRIPEHVNELNIKTKGDTLKKKQRVAGLRNSLEWTSKIFVLVTSGYLLQYAAEGTYNRVPEKILQLTATSAAYASDLIPGKHWVLQVASATDGDGSSFMDAKSRRSKLSMKDNRRVSNMLLIFENPESMDTWLAVLRREIALHGGKKKTSETGKVEAEDPASGIEARPTQRNIVVKDRDRFSYVITQDFSYTEESSRSDYTGNDGFSISSPNQSSTYMIDNASPTASMISSDGQRLDNLRDSSSSHRFSYVSSGQRTMLTSPGSSPACSPTRASFSSQREELQPLPSLPEVRLRPNAAAIVNRRQSMQALISSFEATTEQTSRPYADATSSSSHENEQLIAPSVPNFSVPHAVGKRFSINASAPTGLSHLPQTVDYERSSKSTRKTPPTALLTSRPLSIVIDQPSPRSPCSPDSISRSFDAYQSTPPESKYAAAVSDGSPEQSTWNQAYPRRPSQTGSIRQATSNEYGQSISRRGVDIAAEADEVRTFENMPPRAASSLDSYGSRRRFSGVFSNKDSSRKRSSLLSETRSPRNSLYSSVETDEWQPALADKSSPVSKSSCSPKRSAPSLRSSLSVDLQEKLVISRKSMPQLNDGPPLAPPPNCALPPIPQKPLRRTS